MVAPRLLLAAALAATACGTKGSGTPHDAADASTSSSDGSVQPPGDAAPPAGSDPANDGTHVVTTMTAQIPGSANGRMLAATVFTPDAPAGRALVVISPGFQMARTQYTSYARHLATWGFVVVLTDYADSSFFPDHAKMAADIPAVITWALAQSTLQIDASKIATAGHSLGGKLSVFAASLDARIEAVVGWDPVDSSNPSVVPEKMTALTAAVAVIGETTNASGGGMPCAPAAENFTQFYAAAPSPALQLDALGADHMDWVDDPSCTLCGFCADGTAPEARVRTMTRRLNVAWLRRQLLADTSMDAWLDAPPEVAANHAMVVRR